MLFHLHLIKINLNEENLFFLLTWKIPVSNFQSVKKIEKFQFRNFKYIE